MAREGTQGAGSIPACSGTERGRNGRAWEQLRAGGGSELLQPARVPARRRTSWLALRSVWLARAKVTWSTHRARDRPHNSRETPFSAAVVKEVLGRAGLIQPRLRGTRSSAGGDRILCGEPRFHLDWGDNSESPLIVRRWHPDTRSRADAAPGLTAAANRAPFSSRSSSGCGRCERPKAGQGA